MFSTTTHLFDEEPCINNQSPVEDAEHQKCLPADILDGTGCYLGEDEVEQPLRSRADYSTLASQIIKRVGALIKFTCNTCLADPRRENLAHVELGMGC